ncbi:mucin-2-like [Dicentrarchus labrax]|uniref:mucin-2-like n=1 Tax=Dicentrarchus labrax TaxID=13489 RepID=UPI0021F60495|nr:mucin-2-like [Dicentrarchus labrax]
MSAVLGRMMMMMVWVWISLLTLARFNTAQDQHRDAELTALLEETGSGGRLSPVPVWKFLNERRDGGEASDFGRVQYLCSGSSLSVRFSLIRHTDLRLADGRRLLTDGCQGSVRNLGPWMLLTLPYTSCHLALWVSNGTWFRQLRLRYFDHLLQANVTGLATCENPATSLQLMPPLVTCRTTDVTVKLPLGTRLKRVKSLGKDGVVRQAITTMTPGAVYVQIPTPADLDSIFEVIYLDSAGKTSTMLAACSTAATQTRRDRHPRALQNPNLWELWDFEQVLVEPVIQEPTEPSGFRNDEVTDADTEIFELWGFDEIPEGPYTGIDTPGARRLPPTTTTTTCARRRPPPPLRPTTTTTTTTCARRRRPPPPPLAPPTTTTTTTCAPATTTTTTSSTTGAPATTTTTTSSTTGARRRRPPPAALRAPGDDDHHYGRPGDDHDHHQQHHGRPGDDDDGDHHHGRPTTATTTGTTTTTTTTTTTGAPTTG